MRVSVIIPNYNHAEYLKQRIDSILHQTYSDFELIILDDDSTDNSREIIDDYVSHFPCIKKYYNSLNSGSPFIQWNFGVTKANGEFIWIAESDDFAEPCFLEKTYAILIANENVGLVYCDSKVIDEKKNTEYFASEWKEHLHRGKWLDNYINSGKNEVSDYLYKDNTINNVSGVLFRKNKYLEAGCADNSMKFCGDWLLFIRILLISDIAYISETLNNFRLHSNSTFNYYFSSNSYLKEVFKVYLTVMKQTRLSSKKKFLMLYSLIIKTSVLFMHITGIYKIIKAGKKST